jgi:osmotically-inducible protein OsmY
MTDAQITARVRAEISAARDLPGVRIDVDTREGVVTLSGAVRSAAVKARASEIARTVRGVRDVNDQLTLATS